MYASLLTCVQTYISIFAWKILAGLGVGYHTDDSCRRYRVLSLKKATSESMVTQLTIVIVGCRRVILVIGCAGYGCEVWVIEDSKPAFSRKRGYPRTCGGLYGTLTTF